MEYGVLDYWSTFLFDQSTPVFKLLSETTTIILTAANLHPMQLEHSVLPRILEPVRWCSNVSAANDMDLFSSGKIYAAKVYDV